MTRNARLGTLTRLPRPNGRFIDLALRDAFAELLAGTSLSRSLRPLVRSLSFGLGSTTTKHLARTSCWAQLKSRSVASYITHSSTFRLMLLYRFGSSSNQARPFPQRISPSNSAKARVSCIYDSSTTPTPRSPTRTPVHLSTRCPAARSRLRSRLRASP